MIRNLIIKFRTMDGALLSYLMPRYLRQYFMYSAGRLLSLSVQ